MSFQALLSTRVVPWPRRYPRLWPAVAALWVAVGIIRIVNVVLFYPDARPQWVYIVRESADHLTWAVLALAIVAIRILPAGGWKAFATAALLVVVLTIARLLTVWGLFSLVEPAPPWLLPLLIPSNLTHGMGLLALAQAIRTYDRQVALEQVSTALEAQRPEAELRRLQMQLQPHFLFNALNSISALMRRSVASADRMLGQVKDLLRISLERTRRGTVTLRQELEFLELYLAIEQTRYQDRLRVRFEIADGAGEFPVPHLILQPLVENAIRHGIAPHPDPADLLIAAHVGNGAHLHLEVRDWGAGLSSGPRRNGGVGIAATRSRLEQRYGDDAAFSILSPEEGGTRVTLSFPRPPGEPYAADATAPEDAIRAAECDGALGGTPTGATVAGRRGSIARLGLAYGLFWIALTACFMAIRFVVPWIGAPTLSLGDITRSALSVVGVWGVVGLPALLFSARFPIRKDARVASFLAPLATGCATIVAYSVVHRLLIWPDAPLGPILLRDLPYSLPLVCAFIGLGNYAYYRERERETAIGAARLRSEVTAAELRMLEEQLRPAFLFGALDSISELMRVDVAAADRMLAQLGSVLRLSLDRSGRERVTLREEMEFLEHYLAIEQARCAGRLRVRFEVESGAGEFPVPHLILQPLVENAIRHGLAPHPHPAALLVAAGVGDDGRLHVEIRDWGAGIPSEGVCGEGGGVLSTRARLAHSYGRDASLDVASVPGEPGTRVTLAIPRAPG